MNQIGNVLKEARENKGLTVDDIQIETKIQKRYLVHIEAGELDKLPGNFYAKAFVKQYAEAVGLDSAEILSQYKNEFPEDKKDLSAHEIYNRAHKMNSQEDLKNKLVDNLPKIMVICFVVIAIAAAYLFLMSDSNSNDSATTEEEDNVVFVAPEEEQEPNVNEPADAEETEESDGTTTQADTTKQEIVPVSAEGDTSVYELKNAPAEDFKVTLTATDDCWFEVKNESSGESLYNGVVKPGKPVDVAVPADCTEFSISIGNAGGGKVAVNGVEVVYQLPPADVQVQTIVVKPVAAPVE